MKKHRPLCFILAAMLLLSGCGTAIDSDIPEMDDSVINDRIIVEEFGYTEMSMGMRIADINNLEAITELSSHVILGKVTGIEDITYTEIGQFSFQYTVEVVDILMDARDSMTIDDVLSVTSAEGILKARDAAAMVAGTSRAKKLGILQGEYADNEYILSSMYDAIPIEVGKTYLMFLTDEYLENEGVYAESGRMFLYEIDGQTVHSGRAMTLSEASADNVIDTILAQIAQRTGRADEIGSSAYMLELGERQAADAEIE